MNPQNLIFAVITAIIFCSWPILAKYAGTSLAYTNLIIYTGGLIATVVMVGKRLAVEPVCSFKGLLMVGIASLINGFAIWVYTLKAIDKETNTALFVATVSIVGVVMAPIINIFVNNEQLTTKQWLGVALAIIVVWLMKK